jgi:hypothetical protein
LLGAIEIFGGDVIAEIVLDNRMLADVFQDMTIAPGREHRVLDFFEAWRVVTQKTRGFRNEALMEQCAHRDGCLAAQAPTQILEMKSIRLYGRREGENYTPKRQHDRERGRCL